jgi:hypothetical protein
VLKYFQRKFNSQEAPARSASSCLVQKYELTGSVCDNKTGVMGRHRSANMQGNADGFMNKQNTKFWASENLQRVVEKSIHPAKCIIWWSISKQGLTGPIFVEGTIRNLKYLQQLQNEVIPAI